MIEKPVGQKKIHGKLLHAQHNWLCVEHNAKTIKNRSDKFIFHAIL